MRAADRANDGQLDVRMPRSPAYGALDGVLDYFLSRDKSTMAHLLSCAFGGVLDGAKPLP